ncbi:MAG: glycosyl hydrolase [Flavihumibacter sp.]
MSTLQIYSLLIGIMLSGSCKKNDKPSTPAPSKAVEILGVPASGLPWHSGAWTPGKDGHTAENITEFVTWRGRKLDLVTCYANYFGKFSNVANSEWNVSYQGPGRRLCIGVPVGGDDMPVSRIVAGDGDASYRQLAELLVTYNRNNAIIRIGWEADIPGNWAWHRNAGNCEEYKQAWRHVRGIFASYSKDFKFTFEGSIGSRLESATDNEAWLRLGYPGDDVVDLVGCDVYNFYSTKVNADGSGWNTLLNPDWGLGLQDVADFARQHNKGLIIPEWGLHAVEGPGDVPAFIEHMCDFFNDNKDIMAAECYFNEPDAYIANALWMDGDPPQLPKSAEKYLELFGKK